MVASCCTHTWFSRCAISYHTKDDSFKNCCVKQVETVHIALGPLGPPPQQKHTCHTCRNKAHMPYLQGCWIPTVFIPCIRLVLVYNSTYEEASSATYKFTWCASSSRIKFHDEWAFSSSHQAYFDIGLILIMTTERNLSTCCNGCQGQGPLLHLLDHLTEPGIRKVVFALAANLLLTISSPSRLCMCALCMCVWRQHSLHISGAFCRSVLSISASWSIFDQFRWKL